MVYTCEKCLFTFERKGEISECPDCGKQGIRHSTEEEIMEYRENRKEAAADKRDLAKQ